MTYEIEGKLIVKNDTVQVSDKFKKREYVIETSETGGDGMVFIQKIIMQLTQDRVSLLDSLNIGDNIKATFNIKGRGWRKQESDPMKYFNNLEAWRIEKAEGNTSTPANDAPPPEDDDGLPF